jgi:hypothetical protein
VHNVPAMSIEGSIRVRRQKTAIDVGATGGRRRFVTALGLAALLGLPVLAACRSGNGAQPAASASVRASASPSPSVDPKVADATGKALAAYNGYREAMVAAEAAADYNNQDLPKYVADPLLTQAKGDLYLKQQQGYVMTGRPQWSPQVTTVNVTIRPYTVQITDCLDTTGWDTVNKATGKSVAVPGQAKKYVVTSEAKQYDDGRWLIDQSTADRSHLC